MDDLDTTRSPAGPPRGSPTRLDRAGWIGPATRLAAAATLAYVGVLLYATHHPRPQDLLDVLVGESTPSDKALHLWAYAVLGLLAGGTLALAGGWRPRRILGLAAGLAVFAAFDEATQPLPWFGRFADPVDWIYDVLGIVAGLTLVGLLVAIVARRARTR
jgi:VanZ family protein